MAAVLSGTLPDRVPFAPTIYVDHACFACGKRFEEALADPAAGQRCMLDAAIRYGADSVRFCMGPEESWYLEKIVEERDGKLAQVSRESGRVEGYLDVRGGGALIAVDPPPPPSSKRDVAEIQVIPAAEYVERGCLKHVAQLVQEAHDRGLFVVGMCSGQTINFMVERLRDPEKALLLFYDDPELALALIDKAVAVSIERGKAFIQVGVDCIYIGDSYASGSVISPAVYRRFCAPAYAETAREFHDLGVFCYKHCCGNYNPLLDDLPSTGVDAMDGIDPTCGMSVRRTKEAVGGKLALMGGVSCLTLLNGTAEAVYEEAKRCVSDGKPGGRYVLGSACAVPARTPPENVLAAGRAALNYGKYQ